MEKTNKVASNPIDDNQSVLALPMQQVQPQVPDLSQPEDSVIGSAHQAFEDQVRRSDYEEVEHLSGYEIVNHNLAVPKVQLCRLTKYKAENQPADRPYKVFAKIGDEAVAPRAVFSENGACECSVFFLKYQLVEVWTHLNEQGAFIRGEGQRKLWCLAHAATFVDATGLVWSVQLELD